jgi:hypothetical protein
MVASPASPNFPDERNTVARPKAEQPEEPTPDEEVAEPIEGDDADEEQAETEEQTTEEVATEEGGAELPAKIEAAYDSQIGKLRAIFGTSLEHFLCPLCQGYGTVDPGVTPMDVFAWDETTEECPRCKGMGQLRRHTHAEGHLLGTCTACSGQGWRIKPQEQASVTYLPPTQQPQQPQQNAGAYTAAQAQMGMLQPDGTFVPFSGATTG